MPTFNETLAARQQEVLFASRGYARPATVTVSGVAVATTVLWAARREQVLRSDGEVSVSSGKATINKADVTLPESPNRAGDWGTIALTIDGTERTYTIIERQKESDSVYVVGCALAKTMQVGPTTGRG